MSLFTRTTELKRFKRGALPKVAIAVLLVIPLIYGALYLWAFWAPTDNMNKLPVAVVNLDRPAEAPGGKTLTAGNDVVDELLKGGDLDWKPLDAAEAERAVADGDVYFAVTIPREFSSTLAGLQDDPKAGQIEVQYNDSNSFLASTLGKTAMVQLRDAVAETATETAAEQVLVGVEKLSDGTRQAADAATTLHGGTTTLAQASSQLSGGLTELNDGTAQLAGKAPKLADGAARLADGTAQLAAKAPQLADGTAQLAEGASVLSSKLEPAAAGAPALLAGFTQLNDGSALLATGTGAIAQLAAANPDMTLAQLDFALQSKGTSLQAIAAGATTLHDKVGGALPQVQQLADGLPLAAQGAKDLAAGSAQAATGAAQVNAAAGQLASGAAELSDGASQLVSGTSKLHTGATTAASGSAQLAEGAKALDDGAGSFSKKLNEGAAEAPDFAAGQSTRIAETIAAPVQLSEHTENEVQGFGEGFAPFFIALASFVGALITWLILRPLPRRPLASNVSGLRSVLAGFGPAALIGVGQVVIMMLVLVYAVGMQPVHWVGMAGFMLLVTLAFLALQQMFIALLGTAAGRVVSLVLLMLQLSSSGGTYPVETTPGFFQALHPFMPASYVVTGLRQLIGGGIDARFWGSLIVMLGVLIGSLAISAVAARRQKVWTVARLHPELAL